MVSRHVAMAADERGTSDAVPRWKSLGDEESLRAVIRESKQVLLVCVYHTSLDRVTPPFADVVLRCTVVQAVKGAHRLGDKVSIRYRTDSLPEDEAKRNAFVEAAAAKNLGSLKMAFLRGAGAEEYACEWLNLPAYDPDMLRFAIEHAK